MKLICNGMDFADALSKVIKALPVKKTMPILEGVKLSAFGDRLTMSATDIDFSIIKSIKADVKMEGETLVPGKILNELARKLTSEESVELSDVSDNNLTIKYADSSTFLKVMNAAEYPPIKEQAYDQTVTMLQKDLRDIIDKTIFSAASDGSRPVLKGCLMKIRGDLFECVALDGYRLALCRKKLGRAYDDVSAIVPAKSLFEIAKLLDNDEELVNVMFSSNKIMIDLEHTKVISSLLSGSFLNYENTIPADFETTITVNKSQLEDGIERASILSRYEKSNLIKLEIKEGKMTILSNSEMGESKEIISIFTKGKDVNIGFNAKYISDCLKNIDDEYVNIRINTSTTPTVIVPVEGDGYVYLIVPIRFLR